MTDEKMDLAPGKMLAEPNSTRVASIIDVRDTAALWKFSQTVANSGLVPSHFKGRPDAVMVAVAWGYELGISPMQALQNIAVIKGKPSIYGDLGKDLLLRSGKIAHLDTFLEVDGKRFEGLPEKLDDMVGVCEIRRKDPDIEHRATFSYREARVAGLLGKESPWKSYPGEMCKWRAFWRAARATCADMLGGLNAAEEMITIQPPTPEVVNHGVRTEAKLLDELKSHDETVVDAEVVEAPAPEPEAPDEGAVRIEINAMLSSVGWEIDAPNVIGELFDAGIDLNDTPYETLDLDQLLALRDVVRSMLPE